MGQLGIGIWGAGWVAGGHLDAYLAQSDCRVVAVGSRRLASVEALTARFGVRCAFYTDYQAFLDHPGLDVVSICTPHHVHPSNAIEAAQAGKHVYVEKPVAVTLADLYAVRDAVQRAGVRSTTGFVVRWTPLVARLHELVNSGALGDLFLADVDYWHSRVRPESYRRRATGGSAMLLGGCHAIDTARHLVGADPVEVVARSVPVPTAPDEPYEYDCAEICLVRYANGVIGRISAVVKGHLPYQFNIDLLGSRGTVRNERLFVDGDREEDGFRTIEATGPDSGQVEHHPFRGLIRHFLDAIVAGREPDTSIEQAVAVHEVCFAALLSARTGLPVRLPLSPADQHAIHALAESPVAAD